MLSGKGNLPGIAHDRDIYSVLNKNVLFTRASFCIKRNDVYEVCLSSLTLSRSASVGTEMYVEGRKFFPDLC